MDIMRMFLRLCDEHCDEEGWRWRRQEMSFGGGGATKFLAGVGKVVMLLVIFGNCCAPTTIGTYAENMPRRIGVVCSRG